MVSIYLIDFHIWMEDEHTHEKNLVFPELVFIAFLSKFYLQVGICNI